ncbi:MAG: hypothetical protein AB7G75_36840 [Candidatus Binatia bacterium]
MPSRLDDLVRFYRILNRLEARCGGRRTLATCTGKTPWPPRGVYFFMEAGEGRTDSGEGLRIVRVGTHALKRGSRTTLWTRLSQHGGQQRSGGGNHRGSIFRLLVGTALNKARERFCPTWGQGSTASGEIRTAEEALEQHVSTIIRAMPFLWVPITDDPGPDSLRGYIERNAIALLSNYRKAPLDPPSATWLGHSCDREKVRASGLWNQNHVEEDYAPAFLDTLELLVGDMRQAA